MSPLEYVNCEQCGATVDLTSSDRCSYCQTVVKPPARQGPEVPKFRGDAPAGSGRWIKGTFTAPELIQHKASDVSWYEPNLLAPGIITEVFSPRGIGKTLYAYAVGIKLARQGVRVLLLDRDNPVAEIKRRLSAWGAMDAPGFEIRTRQDVPPLTDRAAWAVFPVWNWDVIILDSFDSATEGIGDKDSGKPSLALAPLLDLARHEGGPAILVLGNTTKDARQARGAGLIQDRADICIEVRDATGFIPDDPDAWVKELPSGDGAAWADRIVRRQGKDKLRLAFMPTKFRVGIEPSPWIIELDMSEEPYMARDVTAEVEAAGIILSVELSNEEKAKLDTAADSLLAEIVKRHEAGDAMIKTEGEKFLSRLGIPQKRARQLMDAGGNGRWLLKPCPSRQGKPTILIPRDSVDEP